MTFWGDVDIALRDRFNMDSYVDSPSEGNLDLTYWGQSMGAGEFNKTIDGDLLWSIGSIVIVLCFLCLHTRSLCKNTRHPHQPLLGTTVFLRELLVVRLLVPWHHSPRRVWHAPDPHVDALCIVRLPDDLRC